MFLFFHTGRHVSCEQIKNLSAQSEVFGIRCQNHKEESQSFSVTKRFRTLKFRFHHTTPIVSSRTRFVTQTNFFLGLPKPPCHKKNTKHFDSDTAKNVLIIGFLQCCNKKKQKKKNLGPALVCLNNTKITRERRIGKNVEKLKINLFFLKRDTDLSFFCFFFRLFTFGISISNKTPFFSSNW